MFKLVKKIESKTGNLHFLRWSLIETSWFNIYIHLICKADEDKHLHNHPWWFCSILLAGGYEEHIAKLTSYGSVSYIRQKPRLSWCDKNSFHQLLSLNKNEPVLSLVITGPRSKDRVGWGYLVNNDIIPADKYRILKNNNEL